MLIKDRKLILQVWSMNSCCSEPLPSKLYNNSFKAVLNLKGNCSLLKNICQFLNFMKNSFRKWWHFWHDVIYLFTGNDSTRTDKMCYRHFCAMQKQQTRSLPSCTEYELPVSIAKRPVKPLWYCGINKNSGGKMHEIISVYHVFHTLGWKKSWPTRAPRAGVISILLLTSKVRINFLFSILLPMKNELNKWNRQIKYFMNKLGNLSFMSLSPLEVTD